MKDLCFVYLKLFLIAVQNQKQTKLENVESSVKMCIRNLGHQYANLL